MTFLPLPLPLLQPLLNKIVERIARTRPQLFNRIGLHKNKLFLIDPINLPFALLLAPHPDHPQLKAIHRGETPPIHARIAGSFLTLLDMIDGRLDGDSLFFTRKLTIEGDTEAIVCLRNALDDIEGSIAEDTADIFGPLGRAGLAVLRNIGKGQHE